MIMRIFIVAASVLGLSLGAALAQGVSFSGSAGMGVMYAGDTDTMVKGKDADGKDIMVSTTNTKPSISWKSFFDVKMAASGTTDGGLEFGAGAKINSNHDGTDSIGASNVYIGGESWKIAIGDLDPASDKGKSIGDVGFDGDLKVDDVAEGVGMGTEADIEVSFSLGTASLAITAGHKPGTPYMKAVAEKSPMHINQYTGLFTAKGGTTSSTMILNIEGSAPVDVTTDLTADTVFKYNGSDHYITSGNVLYRVGGCKDTTAGTAIEGDDCDAATEGNQKDVADTEIGTFVNAGGTADAPTAKGSTFVPGMDAVPAKPATDQDTEWAVGVSFAIGSTTLGIGADSNDLMQASVGADLGAFTGSLYYARQKMDKGKSTGIGAEIGVSAGSNTSVNAVYSRSKAEMTGMADKTVSGFGVGVKHSLGGGAELQAGFAQVDKQNKASAGVVMGF